jgi:hypothetical protein
MVHDFTLTGKKYFMSFTPMIFFDPITGEPTHTNATQSFLFPFPSTAHTHICKTTTAAQQTPHTRTSLKPNRM